VPLTYLVRLAYCDADEDSALLIVWNDTRIHPYGSVLSAYTVDREISRK
jgi:hypothetical protein